jgi:hypothetical protein
VKVPELMLKYLLQKKVLHVQGLGSFRLSNIELAADDQKGNIIPPGALQFTLDMQTKEDPELIAFIAAQTGKIRPLAAADLESAIIQGKQLLNISKPFTLEGIGTLQKNMRNEIEFIPYIAQDKNDHSNKSDKRKEDTSESIHFDDNYLKPLRRNDNRSRNLTMATLFFLGFAIIGWVGYYFYHRSTLQEVELSPISLSSAPAQDTVNSNSNISQSSVKTDSLKNSIPSKSIAEPDESFRVVVEIAKKTRAFKRYADLREWGHNVIMYTSDSIQFKIAFPIKAPLADSIRYRDSLSHFFGRKVWIEKN